MRAGVLVLPLCLLMAVSSFAETVRRPFLHRYLAHALGGIDGHIYLNCREAFELNYGRGFRVFEADFWPTTDGHMVVANDGVLSSYGLTTQFTLQQFEESQILGQYTPVTMASLADLLTQHPEAMVMTDVKSDNVAGLDGICNELSGLGIDCRMRMIPQIYSYEELAPVKARGFDRMVLTLYRFGPTPQEVAAFAEAHPEIAAVVVPDVRVTDATWPSALQPLGVPVYVNTINAQARADALFGLGVTGLFTDVLFDPAAPPPFPPEVMDVPGVIVPPDTGIPAPEDPVPPVSAIPPPPAEPPSESGSSDSLNADPAGGPSGCSAGDGTVMPAVLLLPAAMMRRLRHRARSRGSIPSSERLGAQIRRCRY